MKQAYRAAEELGPIIPVEPAKVHVVGGSPILGSGQVYVMRSATVFHSIWCMVVADTWDNDPPGLLVIAEETIGGRRECKSCKDPLSS